MLVLVSFALVLVATVLLVLGLLVGDGLNLIYLSIALSVLAGVVLFIAVRASKPVHSDAAGPAPIVPNSRFDSEFAMAGGSAATSEQSATAEATTVIPAAPAPTSEYSTAAAPAATPPAPVPVPLAPPPPVAAPAPPPPPAPPVSAAPVAPPAPPAPTPAPESVALLPAADADAGEWLAADQEWGEAEWAEGEDLDFPIAEYDDLTEDEIMPLLPQLYPEEIGIVEERERAGKARPAILSTLASLPREDAEPIVEAPVAPAPPAAAAPPPPPPAAAVEQPVAEWGAEEDAADERYEDEFPFPIDDYDSLPVSEIVSLLGELDDDELTEVKEHEESGRNRRTIVANIDRRLGITPAPSVSPAPPARVAPETAAPTRRAPAAPAPERKAAPIRRASTPSGPYGRGSASPGPRGGQPTGFPIKGNEGSKLYHVPGSPTYARTDAEVYFATEAAAERAGFTKAGTRKAPARKAAAPAPAPARKASAPAKAAAPRVPSGPYGRGSAAPGPRGGQPDGFPIKGNEGSMLYHMPGSATYARTRAEVYFATEAAAERAGFTKAGTRKPPAPAKKAPARRR